MSVHLRVPFEIGGGHALTVSDGSLEEVTQNVRVILSTRPGERLVVADFGYDDPTFELPAEALSAAELTAQVERWEPRATLELASADITGGGTATQEVLVSLGGE